MAAKRVKRQVSENETEGSVWCVIDDFQQTWWQSQRGHVTSRDHMTSLMMFNLMKLLSFITVSNQLLFLRKEKKN